MMRRRGRGVTSADHGAASVVMIATVLVMATAFAAGVATAAAVDTGARARAAADVAALQAALQARDSRALGHDAGLACDVAADIVSRYDVQLRECTVTPTGVVTVQVGAHASGGGALGLVTLHRTARAGPVGAA